MPVRECVWQFECEVEECRNVEGCTFREGLGKGHTCWLRVPHMRQRPSDKDGVLVLFLFFERAR